MNLDVFNSFFKKQYSEDFYLSLLEILRMSILENPEDPELYLYLEACMNRLNRLGSGNVCHEKYKAYVGKDEQFGSRSFPWIEIDSSSIEHPQNWKQKIHNDELIVVMPSIELNLARKSMEILIQRSGISACFILYLDRERCGFVNSVNRLVSIVNPAYVVYTAQDAFPGRSWLKIAFETIVASKAGLLAFNDGKWHGETASFGLVDVSWSSCLYGRGKIFYPGYHSHCGDTELSDIAKRTAKYIYEPSAVLVEVDYEKDKKQSRAYNPMDMKLYESRSNQIDRAIVNFSARFDSGVDLVIRS